MVKGNHDEQASIEDSTEGFNELAEEAIGWTREHLSAEEKKWLAELRLTRQVRDFTIVHATLDTPQQWGYVFNDLDAIASFTYQHTSLCFFGHTHWPTAFVRDDNVRRITTDHIMMSPGKKIFHQHRQRRAAARSRLARGLLHLTTASDKWSSSVGCEYDLADRRSGKSVAAGLPGRLADRLAQGRYVDAQSIAAQLDI